MQLSKHHGLANDFLVILDEVNGRALSVDGELAKRVCDRRTGIGADGLIHGAAPPPGADVDVVMHLYNADGGRAETSGNGIRCLAHAVARAREAAELHLSVETDAGTRAVVVRAAEASDQTAFVEARMGAVGPGPELPTDVIDRLGHAAASGVRRYATADIGNPHLVVEVDDPSQVDLALGAWIDQHVSGGINVEFAAADPDPARDEIVMRVWERGAGATEACGTGACATATVFRGWGWHPGAEQIVVRMPGGQAEIRFERDGEAILAGLVHHVATIELPDA